ncbi:MAG: helix-hairpin-helix domain-containing protein, partial [Planctomycetota bacterium]
MDALALLCTLHADGPATLKRLRARGWTSLGALLASDADDLADGLGVGAPAARRLLREARMLAGRVGLEVLDEEEAPPTSIAEPGGALRPDLGELGDPVDDPATGLDPADRALVSRIVGGAVREDETEALAPVSDEPAEDRTDDGSPLAAIDLVEQFRPPAERAEDAGVTAFELDAIAAPVDEGPEVPERVEDGPLVVPEPAAAPEPECEPEPEPEPEPAADGALFDGALPGLDAALVEDLRAEGIETLEDLAGAKSLLLTRSLGTTFA